MIFLTKLVKVSWLTLITLSFINKGIANETHNQNNEQIDLLLAGGSLPVCSSFTPKNCSTELFSSEQLSSILYQFDRNSIVRFQQSEFYKNLSKQHKENINSLVLTIHEEIQTSLTSKSSISKLLKNSDFKDVFIELPDSLYFALFDFFEVRQLTAAQTRKIETVNFTQSKNENSKKIFKRFYQQAKQNAAKKGKTSPTIIVTTASSRDPFESADFYSGVFNQFDAETQWLPLDMSLLHAIEFSKCDQLEQVRQLHLLFDRERIYPNRTKQQKQLCKNPTLILEQVKSADGIFFNGGDQTRTRAALIDSQGNPTPWLNLIAEQMKSHQLIVAGTSAGTAVQAGGEVDGKNIVMVSNGAPEVSLQRGAFAAHPPSARCSETGSCPTQDLQPGDLTYLNTGGTGLFDIGLLDTHFSERDREVRLAVLGFTTNTSLGFGVDETTALAVSFTSPNLVNMSVIGENGVFIADTSLKQGLIKSGQSNYVAGISHYLTEGDNATFARDKGELKVLLNTDSKTLEKRYKANFKYQGYGEWRHHVSLKCGSRQQISWTAFSTSFATKASNETQFKLNNKRQCSYADLPFVIATAK